jgi:hypothetical protein
MEQRPSWDGDSWWASQNISLLVWKQKVHYVVHDSLSQVPMLSQSIPVNTFLPSSLKIHFKIPPRCLLLLAFPPSRWVIHCSHYLLTDLEPQITQLAHSKLNCQSALLSHCLAFWSQQLIFNELVNVLEHCPSFYQPWRTSWICQKVPVITNTHTQSASRDFTRSRPDERLWGNRGGTCSHTAGPQPYLMKSKNYEGPLYAVYSSLLSFFPS